MEEICIIIPAHNEEASLAKVIDKVRDSKIKSHIIVVDNC